MEHTVRHANFRDSGRSTAVTVGTGRSLTTAIGITRGRGAAYLWLSDDHQDVRAAMVARAEELVTLPQNNYGDIVYEFYRQPPHDAEKAFVAAGDYVSPWGCRTIK